jgi:zinc/manganese transport system substrate-binding protein
MKIKIIMILFFLLELVCFGKDKLFIVTTTEDLKSITQEITKDKAQVMSIARGYQDPHYVDAKPSYILNLRKADLLIAVGLELEIAWLPTLITKSRNQKILSGTDGYLDVSEGCDILEKSTGQVTRQGGDIHPFGNPHYWLDPNNGKIIAKNITNKLKKIDPQNSEIYEKNFNDFIKKLENKAKNWNEFKTKLNKLKIVTYHNSWPNFTKYFDLDVRDFVEPTPGIPPSPKHTINLIKKMKEEQIKIILIEPYFDLATPNKIAKDTNAKVLVITPSVGGKDEIKNYFDLFDNAIKLLMANK